MSETGNRMNDEKARSQAILQHDRTILVEAGAGTGKTSVMSGRVVMLLAEGIEPSSIAAITFTELAASELIERIRSYVEILNNWSGKDEIPAQLKIVLPKGLTEEQKANIKDAGGKIDEITCTTIHGFCNKLIGIYPVEADIDPGASGMDRVQSQVLFEETVESWLQRKLSGVEDDAKILTELVLNDPDSAIGLVNKVSELMSKHRKMQAPDCKDIDVLMNEMADAINKFTDFVNNSEIQEEKSIVIADKMKEIMPYLTDSSKDGFERRLVQILSTRFDSDIIYASKSKDGSKNKGEFKPFDKDANRKKWEKQARNNNLKTEDGSRAYDEANRLYGLCRDIWQDIMNSVPSSVLGEVIEISQEIVECYDNTKKQRAQIDFDDMIFKARDMLKNCNEVRQELGKRFKHVLVDEFQDTDPMQNEILWRLCGDPPTGSDHDCDWQEYLIRPGALFLVGDPKQAIYRFRGANIDAYTEALNLLKKQDRNCLIKIFTNFRSYPQILEYVNSKFEHELSSECGQPGYTNLESNREPADRQCVASLEFNVIKEKDGNKEKDEKKNARRYRKAEAQALAKLCGKLIGSYKIGSSDESEARYCEPRDIALLTPTGSELWIYEYELERLGIPISAPAGKGFYRRQEVKDMIAITRILADSSDSLALGALLRSPLVGLADQVLMDIVCNLSCEEGSTDKLMPLTINSELENINSELAKEVIGTLRKLHYKRNITAPYKLLSEAVEYLRIRPILKQRTGLQADRAIANVESYLNNAKAFDVRGIGEFADAMNKAWSDSEKETEGQADAKVNAVSLNTIHSAKGLEWPIVIPINTGTKIKGEEFVLNRKTNTLYHKVLTFEPYGFSDTKKLEDEERNRERVRLFYVAMTRAKELLIIPRPISEEPLKNTWAELIDFHDASLCKFKFSGAKVEMQNAGSEGQVNEQSLEVFKAESEKIKELQTELKTRTPSRDEKGVSKPEEKDDSDAGEDTLGEESNADSESSSIQGSSKRGLILHKLMEEVIIGLVTEEPSELEGRASELIEQFGETATENEEEGLSPQELAGCVIRTLNKPEIKELRSKLQAEFHVYAMDKEDEVEVAMAGVADAITFTEDGKPDVIIDWKSTVKPDKEAKDRHKGQVQTYLEITGAQRGLIFYMTTGDVENV